MPAQLRQRRKDKDDKVAVTKVTNAEGSKVVTPSQREDDPPNLQSDLTNVLLRHPLMYVLVLAGIPYFLYVLYRVILLQYPPSTFRSAVGLADKRQVLILGTMSSGTSSMADKLSRIGLEVGHEDSDTTWKFVRDGTVSWFHGIRYWPSAKNHTIRAQRISKLCKVQWTFRKNGLSDNYGFGPTLFGNPAYNCSFWHPEFQSCYRHACEVALEREYSCATDSPNGIAESKCQPPFQTTLLQAREPWKIVTSLTAKYCYDSKTETIKSRLPITLQWLLLALQTSSDPRDHCVIQLIQYVITYYNNVLNSKPDIQTYNVEDFKSDDPPCYLLELMGLNSSETTVYSSNHRIYRDLCLSNTENHISVSESRSTATNQRINAINKGRVTLSMVVDVLKRISEQDLSKEQKMQRLLDEMKETYVRLSYNDYPPFADLLPSVQT